jgi:hypothetical protein
LPYKRAEGKTSIAVSTITVTLDISPAPPWDAGQGITLTATVLKDGAPWAGATVMFRMYFNGKAPIIGSKTTGSDGKASLYYTVPWVADGVKIPCKEIGFHAYEYSTGTLSNLFRGYVAYPTRISISAPARVAPGEAFTINGKLEYESAGGVWSGLAGKTVSLYYNGTKIADVTTGSDGSYSHSAVIPNFGTYTLKATFAGEGFGMAIALFGMEVGLPPEIEPMIQYASYALAAVPLLAIGGVVAYNEFTKRF